jgi:hypothetical protein
MLLFADSFGAYGLTANMLNGFWSELGTGWALSTVRPRTGVYAMRGSPVNDSVIRRNFAAGSDNGAVGFAFYFSNNPVTDAGNGHTSDGVFMLAQFLNSSNQSQISICANTDGTISAYLGGARGGISFNATLLGQSTQRFAAGAWNHFEAYCRAHPTNGSVEARINGVTALSLAGIDTDFRGDGIVSQFSIGSAVAGAFPLGGGTVDIADLFAWDTNGGTVQDFVGDKKVYLLKPASDTAIEDWDLSTGASSFELLNNVPPDDDTSFISTAPAGLSDNPPETQVGLDQLPGEVVTVSGVFIAGRSAKTDAGDAILTLGLQSGVVRGDGEDHAVNTTFSYYGDAFEADPATSSPWTPAAVNAAKLSIQRTDIAP